MHPFVKRPSSPLRPSSPGMNSPRGTPSKFKKPMSYTPTCVPTPSRQDAWMKELGLDELLSDDDDLDDELNSDNEPEADQNAKKDHFSDFEFQALQAELDRKEKQREELLLQLKARAEKISAFKSQLQRAEQAKKGQLKILKKRYDMQLQEKENLVNNLQDFIEEQENTILELEAKFTGEDRPSRTFTAKSVEKLVHSVSALQDEKGELLQKVLNSELKIAILEREVKDMAESHKKEMTAAEDQARTLDKEYEEFRKGVVSPRKEKEKCLNEISLKASTLETENDKLKQALQHAEEEWKLERNMLESKLIVTMEENTTLEKKSRDMELKFATIAATPPKVQVKSVVPEEIKCELEQLRAERLRLHDAMSEQQKQSIEQISTLKLEVNKLQSESERRELDKVRLRNEFDKAKLDSEKTLASERKNIEFMVNEIANLEQQLCKAKAENDHVKQEYSRTIEELKVAMESKINTAIVETEMKYSHFKNTFVTMQQILGQTMMALRLLKQEQRETKKQMAALSSSYGPTMKEAAKLLLNQVSDINDRCMMLTERYRKEMALRKKFHNELVDLKGNIRVFCRVRPLIDEDGSGPMARNVVTYDGDDDALLFVNNKGSEKQFELDRVFTPTSTQTEVFSEVSALVTSCIDGFNVCIFAYGQTGSGKTFTMEGTVSNPGINQRALQLLFQETSSRYDWQYTISVSVLEIYNEMLRDLLGEDPTLKLDIKQGKDGLFVPGQRQVEVQSVEELNKVFALGRKNRATASTDMNEHSSRSHAILIVSVEGVNKTTGTKSMGKLNLVDLAGSERVSKSGAEGARMKEAQNINKSLSALGDVIHSLKNKAQHIPYRNTKLTYLLQDSLGGDSKTLMVVQVAPVLKNVGESLCSLNFAQRVRQVELGQATRRLENLTEGDTASPRAKTPKKK